MDNKLTAERVDKIIHDCLFDKSEIGQDGKPKDGVQPVIAECIMNNFGFHPQRLESHREEIVEMLKELPDQFKTGKGDGWSFLNFCTRADGSQWGEHRDCEALIGLGMALGLVRFQLPREMWNILPGGMPYVLVKV